MRRWIAFFTVVSLLPTLAVAQPIVQNQPPVVQNQPPVVQNQAPVVQSQPPVVQTQPAGPPLTRYVLRSGTIVDGTPAGEDERYLTIETASGPVRVRKRDIRTTQYIGAGVTPAGSATPSGPVPVPHRRRSTAGTILFAAGLYTFLSTWVLTMMIGSIASIFEDQALWLALPVAGPMIFYQAADVKKNYLGLLMVDTILQGLGLAATIAGAVMMGSDDDEARGPGVRFAIGPGSLALSGTY